MGGLDGLLVEEGNAQRVLLGVFGVFEMRYGEFGIMNCSIHPFVSQCIIQFRSVPRTGMDKGSLLADPSSQLEAFQRPGRVLAHIDTRIAESE